MDKKTTTIKTTVGMAVLPHFKTALLKFKPDNMTDTSFFEIMSQYVLNNSEDFAKEVTTISKIKNTALLAIKEAEIDANAEALKVTWRLKLS